MSIIIIGFFLISSKSRAFWDLLELWGKSEASLEKGFEIMNKFAMRRIDQLHCHRSLRDVSLILCGYCPRLPCSPPPSSSWSCACARAATVHGAGRPWEVPLQASDGIHTANLQPALPHVVTLVTHSLQHLSARDPESTTVKPDLRSSCLCPDSAPAAKHRATCQVTSGRHLVTFMNIIMPTHQDQVISNLLVVYVLVIMYVSFQTNPSLDTLLLPNFLHLSLHLRLYHVS